MKLKKEFSDFYKQIRIDGEQHPENDKYKPIAYNHIDIQGVAVNVIKNL